MWNSLMLRSSQTSTHSFQSIKVSFPNYELSHGEMVSHKTYSYKNKQEYKILYLRDNKFKSDS